MTKDTFYDCRVDADNVADFLQKYYKRQRYTGRGPGYAAGLLKSYQEEFDENGFCFISHHDSNTGETVAYYKEDQ